MDLDENGLKIYIPTWFKHILISHHTYREPFLEDHTVMFIKDVCNRLKQDLQVFVCAVETLEKYLYMKLEMGTFVEDFILAAISSVFLCSKYVGGLTDLGASQIQNYMREVHSHSYSIKAIKKQEFDIFRTINYNVSTHTPIDDLNILLEYYVATMNLRADLHDLCSAILKLFYIHRNLSFDKLKTIYEKNIEVFRQCVRNRLYFPTGIVLCAFKITKCKNIFDLSKIRKEFGQLISMHEDHLEVLSNVILGLVVNK